MSETTQENMDAAEVENESLYLEEVEYQESLLKKFVTFQSNNTIFGVDAMDVIEIITNCNIRAIPMTPIFVKGVINFRGEVLPIMDLKYFLSSEKTQQTNNTCIVVLKRDDIAIGLMVEEVLQVREVFLYGKKQIPTSEIVKVTSSMVKLEDGVIMLVLDIDKLLHMKTGLC